jgi:hypothetical protein
MRRFTNMQNPSRGLSRVLALVQNKSTGTGAEGASELSKYAWYWIPSIPNFANIDATLVGRFQFGAFSIPWPRTSAFNNDKTFLVKFLRL